MAEDDFTLERSKPRHSHPKGTSCGAQGAPRTGKSPNTSGSFVRGSTLPGRSAPRLLPRTGRFNARGRGRAAMGSIKGPDAMIEDSMRFR